MKLSVIIPNYNHGRFLPRCLDSVLSQTFTNLEIVIADDCSTDDSVEILGRYAKSHTNIRLIFQKQRQLVSRTRHLAIMASRGDYLTTLDSDDYYFDPGKLQREMEIIAFHLAESGKDVCAFSNVVVVNEQGQSPQQQWPDEAIRQGDIFAALFARNCMIPRDFIFSRNLYEQAGGYDPAFNLYEDWDLKIRLSRITGFYYTGLTGIAYRRKGEGLSYVPVDLHIEALKSIWEKNKILIRPEEEEYITSNLLYHLDYIAKNQI